MARNDNKQPARPRQGALLDGDARIVVPMAQGAIAAEATITAGLAARNRGGPAQQATITPAETASRVQTPKGPAIPTQASGPVPPKMDKE